MFAFGATLTLAPNIDRSRENGAHAPRSSLNAYDLAALVFDELTVFSKKFRDGSTSDRRQYLNLDGHSHPTRPRRENTSRDAALSDLNQRLVGLGVDAQPEGVYAENKKPDIRVNFAGFNVPVEIERGRHNDSMHGGPGAIYSQVHPGSRGGGLRNLLGVLVW